MASSTNGSGNLMDEFEEAFQACLHALTKKEANTGVTKEEIELEVQQTTNKFVEVARQMEAFFLQKRFLVSTLKPEMLLKDDNQELKHEISRKDLLINKHYASLEEWKKLLPDMQSQQNYVSKQVHPLQQQTDIRQQQTMPMMVVQSPMQPGMIGNSNMNIMSGAVGPSMGMSGNINILHQQQHLMQSQQQQHLLHVQQMHQMQQQMHVGPPQSMHPIQPVVPFTNRPGPAGFVQNANVLPGPLAYLEKTTSNIDMAGMGDGRR